MLISGVCYFLSGFLTSLNLIIILISVSRLLHKQFFIHIYVFLNENFSP